MSGGVLERLREPFGPDEIEHRPELLCRACLAGNCIAHAPAECGRCGQTISPAHRDIAYVGHAAVTARLLEVDPAWAWQPLAVTEQGLPRFDDRGGLWIKLTVHDTATNNARKVTAVTRLGYGEAGSAGGPDGVKAAISDAIRNAAMRFGVALDLWAGGRGDRVMVDGIPGLPTGPAQDVRAPLWRLIGYLSDKAGRPENKQITEHYTTWATELCAGSTVSPATLADASIGVLGGYLTALDAEAHAA